MNEYEYPTLNTPRPAQEIILGYFAWGTDLDGQMVVGNLEFECDE